MKIIFKKKILNKIHVFTKERCRLTIENPPPKVSSMNHFFLERGLNLKNFCRLGQNSIS
jgi:hypothetical protein